MKNKGSAFFAGLLLILLFSAGVSWAEKVSNGNITLDYVIPHGGSATNLSGGGITLYDLKSQPVIGVSTVDTTYLYAGFGYLWPALYAAPINVKAYLQGFYKAIGDQYLTSLLLEARNAISPELATLETIVGIATVELGSTGQSISSEGTLLAGQYYIVFKHPKEGTSIHLPVITAQKVDITENGLTFDLTTGEAYTPGGKMPALLSYGNSNFMRTGDADGNKRIEALDNSYWYGAYGKYDAQPSEYDPRADFNGDGKSDGLDNSYWFGAYTTLSSQEGVHSYVKD